MFVCLFVCLFDYLLIRLFIWLFIYLRSYLFIYLLTYLVIYFIFGYCQTDVKIGYEQSRKMNHFWGHPIYLFIRRFKTIMRCRRLRKRPCQDDQHLLVDTALLWLPLLDLRTHPDSVSSVRRRPRGPRSCCRAASHIGSASLRSGNITPSAKHQIPNGHGTGQEPEIVVF